MASESVMEFYEFLASSAKYNEAGEKPLLFLAILEYILSNEEMIGFSLLEMMHIRYLRKIQSGFLRLAHRRVENPKTSWNTITDPTKPEMKKKIEKYSREKENIEAAFAKPTRKEVEAIVDIISSRLEDKYPKT